MGRTRHNHMMIFFFLLLTTFLNIVSSSCPAPNNRLLFIFGDQDFDVGNNNYYTTEAQANYGPYGRTFFNYPSGRFSDGRLICDFIAEYMGLPLIRPYLEGDTSQFTYGVNFASALSGALPETYQDFFPVKDLQTQLSYFKNVTTILKNKKGDGPSKKMISEAIYLFSVGTNDYLAPFWPSAGQFPGSFPYYHPEFVGRVIENVMNVTKEIYKLGGRKFGFLNVGPLGCFPYIYPITRPNGCNGDANDLATSHNIALSLALEQMEKENDGFRYAIHKLYDSISARMGNPSQHDFTDGNTACCGSEMNNGDMTCGGRGGYLDYTYCENPSDYLFFDGLDLSEKANKQIAELFWNGTSSVTGPNNLKSLLND